MRITKNCDNNNSINSLTSRRTDGGKHNFKASVSLSRLDCRERRKDSSEQRSINQSRATLDWTGPGTPEDEMSRVGLEIPALDCDRYLQ